MENFLDEEKTLVCRKPLACGKPLFVENLLDEGEILAFGKLSWWRESLFLWKTSFMKKKFRFLENFLDEKKTLASGRKLS